MGRHRVDLGNVFEAVNERGRELAVQDGEGSDATRGPGRGEAAKAFVVGGVGIVFDIEASETDGSASEVDGRDADDELMQERIGGTELEQEKRGGDAEADDI